MQSPIDIQIDKNLRKAIISIEKKLTSDVIFLYGPLSFGLSEMFREMIDELKRDSKGYKKLSIILTTTGGSAEEVERCVNVIRHHYDEINFIVPDYAYSAGTIFCMSGDSIFMNYFSVLGPIDPQVLNKDGRWVAALGYLDKVNEMIEKSKKDELSQAEFMMLNNMDLGELREYEQAKELTIDLLETWLAKYKFKSWTEHKTDPDKIGKPVTEDEKRERASYIAKQLSDNKKWKSHGRPINMETLRNELRLEINDFSENSELEVAITSYYTYVIDYINKMGYEYCLDTRKSRITSRRKEINT